MQQWIFDWVQNCYITLTYITCNLNSQRRNIGAICNEYFFSAQSKIFEYQSFFDIHVSLSDGRRVWDASYFFSKTFITCINCIVGFKEIVYVDLVWQRFKFQNMTWDPKCNFKWRSKCNKTPYLCAVYWPFLPSEKDEQIDNL